jgi:hypothetical protein
MDKGNRRSADGLVCVFNRRSGSSKIPYTADTIGVFNSGVFGRLLLFSLNKARKEGRCFVTARSPKRIDSRLAGGDFGRGMRPETGTKNKIRLYKES